MNPAQRLAELLTSAPMEVLGRLRDSSNNALVVEVAGIRAVYKPAAGERPLWDFPDATLGHREVAAYELSQLIGWDLIPTTVWLDDGPAGPGVFQEWVEGGIATDHVDLFDPDQLPPGWHLILQGEDGEGKPVVVAHSDSELLRKLCIFDMISNNADRKAGHLLQGTTADAPDGALFAIDHGVCFHTEPKLRTVLWGFAGQQIPSELLESIQGLAAVLAKESVLDPHLNPAELSALRNRTEQVLSTQQFAMPAADRTAIPWPIF